MRSLIWSAVLAHLSVFVPELDPLFECASAGNCAAGGYWLSSANGDEHSISSDHAFVATETRGRWKALPVPGLAALGSQDSTVETISCQPHRGCVVVGDYAVHGRNLFTTSRRYPGRE